MTIYELSESSPVRSITGPRIIGEVFRFCPARTAVAGAPPDFAGIVFEEDDVALSWFTGLPLSTAPWLQRLLAERVPGLEHCSLEDLHCSMLQLVLELSRKVPRH